MCLHGAEGSVEQQEQQSLGKAAMLKNVYRNPKLLNYQAESQNPTSQGQSKQQCSRLEVAYVKPPRSNRLRPPSSKGTKLQQVDKSKASLMMVQNSHEESKQIHDHSKGTTKRGAAVIKSARLSTEVASTARSQSSTKKQKKTKIQKSPLQRKDSVCGQSKNAKDNVATPALAHDQTKDEELQGQVERQDVEEEGMDDHHHVAFSENNKDTLIGQQQQNLITLCGQQSDRHVEDGHYFFTLNDEQQMSRTDEIIHQVQAQFFAKPETEPTMSCHHPSGTQLVHNHTPSLTEVRCKPVIQQASQAMCDQKDQIDHTMVEQEFSGEKLVKKVAVEDYFSFNNTRAVRGINHNLFKAQITQNYTGQGLSDYDESHVRKPASGYVRFQTVESVQYLGDKQLMNKKETNCALPREQNADLSVEALAYLTYLKRLKSKTFRGFWRLRDVLTQKSKLASLFHSTRLAAATLKHFQGVTKKSIQKRAELQVRIRGLHSILEKAKKKRLFRNFIKVVNELKELRLMDENEISALRLFQVSVMTKIVNQWRVYTKNRKQKKNVNEDVRQLASKKILAKTFEALKMNIQVQRDKRNLRSQADNFCHGIVEERIKAEILRELSNYTYYRKQLENAIQNHQITLKFKTYAACIEYSNQQKKKRQQLTLVRSFYRCNLVTKVMSTLREYATQSIQKQQDVNEYLRRSKMRKIISVLKDRKSRKQRVGPMTHPFQIYLAHLWLKHSFSTSMLKHWHDYPQQKQTQNPKSKKDLFLLVNYLTLSHIPRYRDFYYAADQSLQRFAIQKVFDTLYLYAYERKARLAEYFQSRQLRVKQTFMQTLRYQSKVSKILSKLQQDRVRRYLQAFADICSNLRSLKEAYDITRSRADQRMQSKFLTIWRLQHRKHSFISHHTKMANTLIRQRTLSKYLTQWFHALHQKLKVKHHLLPLKSKFVKEHTMRPFFKKWRQFFLQNQSQAKIESKIVKKCNLNKLRKGWKGLSEYREVQMRKKAMRSVADQEYTYWLGKRCFFLIVRNAEMRQERRKLILDFNQKRTVKLLSNAFEGWLRTKNYGKGLVMLQDAGDRLSLKRAFRKIYKVVNEQRKIVSYFHTEEHPYWLKRHAFRSLKRYMIKRRILWYAAIRVKERQKRKYFATWRNEYLQEASKVALFAKALFQIRSDLLKKSFRTLFLYTLKKALKRRARRHLVWKSLTSCFQRLKLFTQKKKATRIVGLRVSMKNRLRKLRRFMQNWEDRFLVKVNHKLRLHQAKMARKKLLFNILKNYMAHQKNKKTNISMLQTQLKQMCLRKNLLKFQKITLAMSAEKHRLAEAVEAHQVMTLFRCVQAWKKRVTYKQQVQEKGMLLSYKALLSTKQKAFSKWFLLIRPIFQRGWARDRLEQLILYRTLRRVIRVWSNESRFLQSLEDRAIKGSKYFQAKRVVKAIRQLKMVTQISEFKRLRDAQTLELANKKLKQKALLALFIYHQDKVRQRHLQKTARVKAESSLLRLGFTSLLKNCVDQTKLKRARQVLQLKQIKLYGGPLLRYWQSRAKQVRLENVLHRRAYEHFRQKTMYNTFIALRTFKINSKTKALMKQHADRFANEKLLDRAMRAFITSQWQSKEKSQRENSVLYKKVAFLQEKLLQMTAKYQSQSSAFSTNSK